MGGYWWGVLTPFAIVLGILLLWLAGSLFAALSAFICDRLGFGVPWLPLRTGSRVVNCGPPRPGRPQRRVGWSIDEAGQSGRK